MVLGCVINHDIMALSSCWFYIYILHIQVGCRQFIYLFDVVSLGASCFDEGLGDILRSADILKVSTVLLY